MKKFLIICTSLLFLIICGDTQEVETTESAVGSNDCKKYGCRS